MAKKGKENKMMDIVFLLGTKSAKFMDLPLGFGPCPLVGPDAAP